MEDGKRAAWENKLPRTNYRCKHGAIPIDPLNVTPAGFMGLSIVYSSNQLI
jgi:hypothetical protein